MKLLHTADWHLGHTFYGYDRQEEHQHFLNWLLQTVSEQQPDALLLSGDIFDSPFPSAKAEQIFYDFLCQITQENKGIQIIFTGRSHGSAARLDIAGSLLCHLGISIRNFVKHNHTNHPDFENLLIPITSRTNSDEKIVVLAVPFLQSNDYCEGNTTSQRTYLFIHELEKVARNKFGKDIPLVVMTHFSNADAKSEKDHPIQENFDWPNTANKFSYIALDGSPISETVGNCENVRYTASPLPLSFSEMPHEYGVYSITLNESVSHIDWCVYEPLRHMISIPKEGVAGIEEIPHLLSKLPKASKIGPFDNAPYLEVKISEQHPTPSMLQSVMRILDEHKIRLCSIRRVRPNGEEPEVVTSIQDMPKDIQAVQLVRSAYRKEYQEEMPDDLARLFAEAKREATV